MTTGSCDVCIDSDGGDCEAEVCVVKQAKARKPWRCVECRQPIAIGDLHEVVKGKWDGEWDTIRTCLPCVEIRTMATCGGGYIYGMVWEDIREQMFPVGTLAGCLSRLESAKAKEKLAAEWRDWKGLTD